MPSAHNRPSFGSKSAPFGAATEPVRAFLVVASGLTPAQASAIGAAMEAQRNMAWLSATATAWKIARKSGLQGVAERAHGMAFAATAGDESAKEAAAFAVLPLVLGRRLDDATRDQLVGPWETGLRDVSTPEA